MTDQSRVEAVANAIGNVKNRQGNFAISAPGDALAIAQAAIEASDAWLADDWTTRRKLFNEQMRALVELRFKPSPEEPNQ